jgi:CheY-like chemotaxis protein
MEPRILAIDDEEIPWLENFRAWIPKELAIRDFAATTPRAIELLRKYRYHVVLLDLSMDDQDTYNRGNRAIQEYLATRPEGTLYILVSGVADKGEVRDSILYLNARDVIFKPEIEPAMLRDKVTRAIEEASKHDSQLIADAKRKLTGAPHLEDHILKALKPKEGAGGMYPMMDTLFHRIAPVAVHRDRPYFEVSQDCVLGLVWSRKMGSAISIVLANRSMPEEESIHHLDDWLGYPHPNQPLFSQDSHRVRIQLFQEPSISDTHFDLPVISMTGV